MRRNLRLAPLLLDTGEIALDSLEVGVQLREVAIVLLVDLLDDALEVIPTAKLGRRMPAYVIARTATEQRLSTPAFLLQMPAPLLVDLAGLVGLPVAMGKLHLLQVLTGTPALNGDVCA